MSTKIAIIIYASALLSLSRLFSGSYQVTPERHHTEHWEGGFQTHQRRSVERSGNTRHSQFLPAPGNHTVIGSFVVVQRPRSDIPYDELLLNTRMTPFQWKKQRRPPADSLAALCDVVIFDVGLTLLYDDGNSSYFGRSEGNNASVPTRQDRCGASLYATSLIQRARTVFVYSRLRSVAWPLLEDFLRNCVRNDQFLVVVAAGSDWTFPNSIDMRDKRSTPQERRRYLEIVANPKVSAAFVENIDEQFFKNSGTDEERELSVKLKTLPLGVSRIEGSLRMQDYTSFYRDSYFSRHCSQPLHQQSLESFCCPQSQLRFTNFNRLRDRIAQFSERSVVQHLIESAPKWLQCYHNHTNDADGSRNSLKNSSFSHRSYLQKLASQSFTVAVHGGGLDPNPKVWEAILVGSIPIIRKSSLTDIYNENELPVVIINSSTWVSDSITPSKLQHWCCDLHKHFIPGNSLRNSTLRKLTMAYWWEKIENESTQSI